MLNDCFIEGFEHGIRQEGARRQRGGVYNLLQRYPWPGNVRELRNVVERAVLLADGHRLEGHDITCVDTAMSAAAPMELPGEGLDLEDLERSLVVHGCRRCGWNRVRASALLGA